MPSATANLLLLMSALCVLAEDTHEPMVAFHCDQPAMYQSENGWVKDDSAGCMKDATEVLSYCRKVFPLLDVRNIVEASEKVTIPNWCDFEHTMCNQQFTVLPFRCLVGPFQSDALLVPEHCIFDHIHDSKLCQSYGEWNQTSFRSCHDREMILQSFAMLQPCDIDRFNGVEFVCCPTEEVENKKKPDVVAVVTPGAKRSSVATTTVQQQAEKPKTVVKGDDFTDYVNQPTVGHKWNEHEYYVKAKNDMRKHHHDKVGKMMKDWAAARQRVQDLKAVDPKASEKLNKEITGRFQKTYEAEEVESELEKKQLAMLHQQRVQAELNEKKRRALDNFVDTINDYDTDSTEILKSLKHFIKTLQKDRLHTVNRFKHLQETDPADADANRSQMADHIRGIDQQLGQALAMLDRVPKFKNKVKKLIEDYLDSYHSIDVSISVLLLDPPPTSSPDREDATVATDNGRTARNKVEEDVEDEYENDDDVNENRKDDDDDDVDATTTPDEDYYDGDENDDDDNDSDDDDDDEVDANDDAVVDRAASTVLVPSAGDGLIPKTSTSASESIEDEEEEEREEEKEEEDEIHVKHDVHGANMDKNSLHVKEVYIQKSSSKSGAGATGFNAAVPLGIAVGGITVFVVIVVGVVVMRRRARQRRPRGGAALELDPAASPEERHVASMQMNGYENPTYKYFEKSASA